MARTAGLTAQQIYGERLLNMKPEEFLDQSSFSKDGDNKRPEINYAIVMNSTFRTLFTFDTLSEIIFTFLKKWPASTNHEVVADAASALVYHKHYEFIHGKEMSEKIDKQIAERFNIKLTDKKPNIIVEEKKKKKSRLKDVGDDIAIKLRSMDVKQMIVWEKELGVPAEVIEKQETLALRSVGLARMQISNKIRVMLKKSVKSEEK